MIKICFRKRDEFLFSKKAEKKFQAMRLPVSKQDETGCTRQTEKPTAKGKRGSSPEREKDKNQTEISREQMLPNRKGNPRAS